MEDLQTFSKLFSGIKANIDSHLILSFNGFYHYYFLFFSHHTNHQHSTSDLCLTRLSQIPHVAHTIYTYIERIWSGRICKWDVAHHPPTLLNDKLDDENPILNPAYIAWQRQDQVLLGFLFSQSEASLTQVVGLSTYWDVLVGPLEAIWISTSWATHANPTRPPDHAQRQHVYWWLSLACQAIHW